MSDLHDRVIMNLSAEVASLKAQLKKAETDLERLREANVVAACEKCDHLGYVPCDDPQCGDSTWDHYCNERKCAHE